jgi:hypothetical protein
MTSAFEYWTSPCGNRPKLSGALSDSVPRHVFGATLAVVFRDTAEEHDPDANP